MQEPVVALVVGVEVLEIQIMVLLVVRVLLL
jgi:hypothetical protein